MGVHNMSVCSVEVHRVDMHCVGVTGMGIPGVDMKKTCNFPKVIKFLFVAH